MSTRPYLFGLVLFASVVWITPFVISSSRDGLAPLRAALHSERQRAPSRASSPPDVMRPLEFPWENCITLPNEILEPLRDPSNDFHFPTRDVGRHSIPRLSTGGLPRLAWVIILTAEYLPFYARNMAQIQSYCSRRGIPLFIELELYSTVDPFMNQRHRQVARHLQNFEWILVTDADVMVANSEVDARDFLDDSVDVIFNDTVLSEIGAFGYFLKNSKGGREWLIRWVNWGNRPGGEHAMNTDNGDLMELILAGIGAGGWKGGQTMERQTSFGYGIDPICYNRADPFIDKNSTYWNLYSEFISCYSEALLPYRTPAIPRMAYNLDLYGSTVKVKIFRPFGGFMRWMQGRFSCDYAQAPIANFLPGDFIVTGKGLGRLITAEMVHNDDEWEAQPQLGIAEARVAVVSSGWRTYIGCFDSRGRWTCEKEMNAAIEGGRIDLDRRGY